MPSWLRFVIAFVVFCHGFVYVRIGAVLPGPVKGWKGISALVGGAVTGTPLVVLVRTLHVVAGIAILACAVAIEIAPHWWAPLAIWGAVAGLLGFAAFFDGQRQRLFDEGALGAAASLVLLLAAILFPSIFGR